MSGYASLMAEHVLLQQLHIAVRREMSELRRDAERYRWLRDDASPGGWQRREGKTAEQIDALIDAAMNPRTPEG
jgi:hypothetical protein